MDSLKLASGDNASEGLSSPRPEMTAEQKHGEPTLSEQMSHTDTVKGDTPEITTSNVKPDLLENNEIRIKERIEECRNIIETLKLELSAEKSKAKLENLPQTQDTGEISSASWLVREENPMASTRSYEDIPYSTEFYSTSVDSKLACDENLMQYEKQLQKYQKTLNMAQIEKRNAIRKQMLAKAFKLKLLEIENQCNTELIRVKQSMQCLEPLKLVADSWKFSNDTTYNLDNFELMPRYPAVSSLAPMKDSLVPKELNDNAVNNEES